MKEQELSTPKNIFHLTFGIFAVWATSEDGRFRVKGEVKDLPLIGFSTHHTENYKAYVFTCFRLLIEVMV